MVDKNTAMLDYLSSAPGFESLAFEFGEAADDQATFNTMTNDDVISEDILGNQRMYYDFAIVIYKKITTEAYVTDNIDNANEVNQFREWVRAQNKQYHFPDFGEDCEVEEIQPLQNNPTVSRGKDHLAKYLFQCRVIYTKFAS